MNRSFTLTLVVALLLVGLTGCNAPWTPVTIEDETTQPSTSESGATSVPALATPIADSPAAGICGESEGEIVTMTINPDMPDPRCLKVRSEQRLRVVNQRDEALEITLGGAITSLQPGEETTFTLSFGELLLPGVHALQVSPCCGGEIVLSTAP